MQICLLAGRMLMKLIKTRHVERSMLYVCAMKHFTDHKIIIIFIIYILLFIILLFFGIIK